MARALVGLGSNVGNRPQNLATALEMLRATAGVRDVRASSWHETPAVGGPTGQMAFLNAAAVFETSLAPLELLCRLQAIEQRLGRVRTVRWGPRTIDLDLLLYENLVLNTPEL